MTWKKPISLFFLLLAYALLTGHSVIPHHHHDTKPVAHQHSHHHHHHHGSHESPESDAGHSHFLHQTDFLRMNTTSGMKDAAHASIPVAVLPESHASLNLPVPPLLFSPPPVNFLFYHSPHAHALGLRAPPVFVA